MQRTAGILMPIFSLPGPYGIGTLGSEARTFADFLQGRRADLVANFAGGPHRRGGLPLHQRLHLCGQPAVHRLGGPGGGGTADQGGAGDGPDAGGTAGGVRCCVREPKPPAAQGIFPPQRGAGPGGRGLYEPESLGERIRSVSGGQDPFPGRPLVSLAGRGPAAP